MFKCPLHLHNIQGIPVIRGLKIYRYTVLSFLFFFLWSEVDYYEQDGNLIDGDDDDDDDLDKRKKRRNRYNEKIRIKSYVSHLCSNATRQVRAEVRRICPA